MFYVTFELLMFFSFVVHNEVVDLYVNRLQDQRVDELPQYKSPAAIRKLKSPIKNQTLI